MIQTRFIALALVLLVNGFVFGQDTPASAPAPSGPTTIKIPDLEGLTLAALRKEFPRLPGMLAAVHSCRLPDYGPLISVSIQLPAYFFTRPVLAELERRQKIAEEQTRKVRTQIEKAAQVITLRAREATLVESIDKENSSKRKNKQNVNTLQNDLSEVRKTLASLESDESEEDVAPIALSDPLPEVDLNKMLQSNYQQMIDKISEAMKNTLVENGPKIQDLRENERIGLNAFIRDSMLGNQGKTIIFVLNNADIQAFRKGEIDLPALKQKIVVKYENRE
jgi:hypothetical protein